MFSGWLRCSRLRSWFIGNLCKFHCFLTDFEYHSNSRFLSSDYRNLPRSQSIIGLMTSAVFAPLAIMSYINHQEARFLLPLTLPITLLHGHKLDGISFPNPFTEDRPFFRALYDKFVPPRITKKTILRIWYTTTIILVIFYGFLHQGGVYQLSAHFSQVMKVKSPPTNVHLITSHMYSFPVAFLNTPSSKTVHIDRVTRKKYRRGRQFFINELGSADITRVLPIVSAIVNSYETESRGKYSWRYQIYVAMPTSLSDEFDELYKRNMTQMKFSYVRSFYPHLSTEALPNPRRE